MITTSAQDTASTGLPPEPGLQPQSPHAAGAADHGTGAWPDAAVRDLAKSGLSVADVEAVQWYAIPNGTAYCIPYFDPATGQAMLDASGRPFVRRKLLNPRADGPRYLSEPGAGIRVFVPAGAHAAFAGTCDEVLGTEGEKKALLATLRGLPCFALTGISCWRAGGGSPRLSPDLARYAAPGRAFVFIYDSDGMDEGKRADFTREAQGFALALAEFGATLDIVYLPRTGTGKTGLDDLMLADGWDVARVRQYIAENRRRITPESPMQAAKAGRPWPLTDAGNGERFAWHHRARILFDVAVNAWRAWVGDRWAKDEPGLAMRLAVDTARSIRREAAAAPPGATDWGPRLFSWATKSESHTACENTLAMAKSHLARPARDFDADPFEVNTKTGILRLRGTQIEFRRHDPRSDLLTKVAGTGFDPSATAPQWEKFLLEITGGDTEMVAYLRRVAGYMLTGDVTEEAVFFLYGTGANGKSVFCELVMAAMGDYAVRAPASLLTTKGERGEQHPCDLALLKGARLAVLSEIDEGARFTEARLKDLASREPITARFVRENFFSFPPTHKLVIYGNHRPSISGTDEGIWRRLHLIPFPVTIPPERRDRGLTAKLMKELPGILNWILQGYLEWQERGSLGPPAAVSGAVTGYREDMDTIGRFLADCCRLGPREWVQSGRLYQAYQHWAQENGEPELRMRALTNRLRERGFKPDKLDGDRVWRGLSLVEVGSLAQSEVWHGEHQP